MRITPLALVVLTGCATARAAPRPITPAPTAAPGAQPASPPSGLPLSIERLVNERRGELADAETLTIPLGDARGRARAAREVTELADELRAIEVDLRAGATASEHLDVVVLRLKQLETRLALLHEALRVAASPPTVMQMD